MRFRVYGGDHSPWVQAVLLGLHDKGIEHSLQGTPPLGVFLRAGVLMPAASVDGGPWQHQSAALLKRIGYQPPTKKELEAITDAWQGVLHRADSALHFLDAFARMRERHASPLVRLTRHFLRSYAALYFFTLLRIARRRLPPEPADFGDQFLHWQERLKKSGGPFIGGKAPNACDLLLFGIVQCHASIPTPPLAALQGDRRLAPLRAWIAQMQTRFKGYPHLYSGAHFKPSAPAPQPASPAERAAFWLGLAAMLALIPLSLPLVLYQITRVPR